MKLHYYLSIFPTEAVIASHLAPESFGVYMATGSGRASAEPVTFIELKGDLPEFIDTAYAKAKVSKLPENVVKKSLYLSIYRCLEQIPLANLGTLHLVTRDGRSLPLKGELVEGNIHQKPVYLYHELCPVRPLIVSSLEPVEFIRHLTRPDEGKIQVPRIAIADFKVIDLTDLSDSGNIGNLYCVSNTHLRECFDSVMHAKNPKKTKTLGRSRLETFNYQVIDTGIFIGDADQVMYYRMKTRKELNTDHYAWAKSAMIL